MARRDEPVGQPGHRGRVQAQGPRHPRRPGPAQFGQDGQHPVLGQRDHAVEDIQAAQRDPGQDPGRGLQRIHLVRELVPGCFHDTTL
jgi:hypothetical protein